MALANARKEIAVSITELKILTLLARAPKGMFGSQIVHQSNGFVPRGSIYVTLDRLEDKNLVEHEVVPGTQQLNLERSRYAITKEGREVIKKFAKEFGFIWKT